MSVRWVRCLREAVAFDNVDIHTMNVKHALPPADSTITIYTDGSCVNNGSPFAFGGWAAVLEYPQEQRRISGRVEPTTSSRMELTAILEGLHAIRSDWSGYPVTLFTDSQYAANGCTQWRHGWKKRGWKTAQGKPVANLDLWEQLDILLDALPVDVRWIKGHNGEPLNELADKMALAAAYGNTFDMAYFQTGDTREHFDRCGIPNGGLFGGVIPT